MSAAPVEFDIAVAGGGLIGLASAWYLRERGYTVAVLEAGQVGRKASWAGGGILFPIYPWKYPPSVQALAQRGRAIYDEFTRSVDACSAIDSENRRTGLCVLDTNEIEAALRWADAYDEPVEHLGAEALARRQPGLAASDGVHFPMAAQVRNPRLCQSLRAALIARGVPVLEQRPVTAIRRDADRFLGFETARGVIRAARGVVACGAWSAALLEGLCDVPLYPVKGQMLLLQGAPDTLGPVLLRDGRYVIPRADGRILVGSTLEYRGFSVDTDTPTAQELIVSAAAMMPALGRLRLERHWAGLRPASADGLPLIGGVADVDGLYVNTAQYRNGVLCAPASAEVLCRAIEPGVVAPEPAFDPARCVECEATSSCR